MSNLFVKACWREKKKVPSWLKHGGQGPAAGLTLPRTESFPCPFNAVKWVIEQLNGVIMTSN